MEGGCEQTEGRFHRENIWENPRENTRRLVLWSWEQTGQPWFLTKMSAQASPQNLLLRGSALLVDLFLINSALV